MHGDALQTFKTITSANREKFREILAVFCRKYVKLQILAMPKRKFQWLVLDQAIQKLIDFLDELHKLAKDLGVAGQAISEQFIYAKMPSHLKKSNTQAHLEKSTYEQIVSHLETELELNGLEAPDEFQMNTVTQQTVKPWIHILKNPNQLVTTAKKQPTIKMSVVNSNERKTKPKTTQIVPTTAIITTEVKQTLAPITRLPTIPTQTIQTTE